MLGAIHLPCLVAQSKISNRSPQEFEVASIKPNRSGDTHTMYRLGWGGSFMAKNATVKFLITLAYGIKNYQIAGGPGWVGSQRYNIDAKASGNPDPEMLEPMLQRLLANRFKLVTHQEIKKLPSYDLLPEKSGAKL